MPYRKLVTRTLQRYWRLTRSLHLDVAAILRDPDGNVLLVRKRCDGAPWQLPGGPVGAGLTAEQALRQVLARSLPVGVVVELRLLDILAIGPEPLQGHVAVFEGAVRAPTTDTRSGAVLEAEFAPLDRLPQPLGLPSSAILKARSASGAAQQS